MVGGEHAGLNAKDYCQMQRKTKGQAVSVVEIAFLPSDIH